MKKVDYKYTHTGIYVWTWNDRQSHYIT